MKRRHIIDKLEVDHSNSRAATAMTRNLSAERYWRGRADGIAHALTLLKADRTP
jgi:hypothetical protein